MAEQRYGVLIIDGQEIHVIGDYVSVVWNLKEEVKTSGRKRTINLVREGEPFVSFPWIRGEGDDRWVDEDDTVSGGLSSDEAKKVSKQLALAAEYIDNLEK